MHKAITIATLATSLLATAAWAQDETDLSVAESSEVTRGYLSKEVIGLKPQIGAAVFTDQLGNTTSRAIEGITVDANIATLINKDWNLLYLGPSTGVLYSHLGNPTSNFLGSNPSSTIGTGGANLLIIPANIKIGSNITDFFRVAVHGGGNVVYRSVASSLFMGASSATSNSVWRLFPNAGGDAEFTLGKNVALMLRPDWTLTPGNTLFTGTVALNIPIG